MWIHSGALPAAARAASSEELTRCASGLSPIDQPTGLPSNRSMTGERYTLLTDAIKDYPEVDSNKAMRAFKAHPEVIEANIDRLREELGILGEVRALVAMGRNAYDILSESLHGERHIARIERFSSWCSKELYRQRVLSAIGSL